MRKFEVKIFVALIAFHDSLRNEYFEEVEAQGLDSRWDVYHVLADEEKIPIKEVEIMRQIYNSSIQGKNEIELRYDSAVNDFRENIRRKIAGSN